MTSTSDPAAPVAYPVSTCRSCPARIIWADTTGGKLAPIDADPAPGGNIRLDGPAGRKPVAVVVSKIEAQGGTGYRWPHFSTCPQRDQWRTRGRRGAK